MAQRFGASVSAWVAETKERMVAVRNIATEAVVEDAQRPVGAGGNMPIDTGFLRASLAATTGMIPAGRGKPKMQGPVSYDPGELTLVLLGADISRPIYIVWTANYARHVNYGSRGRAGRRFRDLAVQNWQRHVAEAVTKVGGGRV